MTAADFRRIALSLKGAEEGSHMGSPDYRVGGRIFATLASEKQGDGNLMLTPEQQADFVEEQPDIFLPIAGGWGRMGMTRVLAGALQTARRLWVEKNAKRGNARPSLGGWNKDLILAKVRKSRAPAHMAKVTSKYQVTVPRRIAEEYQIHPGDDIEWMSAGEVIRVVPAGKKDALESKDSRLRWFDQATERHRKRPVRRVKQQARDRGWSREDLYVRGRSR